MLGRQVTFRIAVGVPQLQSRTYSVAQPRQLTTLLRRVNSKAVRHNIRDTTFVQRRSYAGTSEDNVGEPSKRVKRAVKKDASTDSGKSSSKRSVAARKKKDAPKKTKAGKGSSNASPVKKAAKPPRELNDEQQLARKIKELKAAALSPPINSFRAVSAYNEFVGEYTAKKRSEFSPSSENESFSAKNLLKEASETFRKITPAELEVRYLPLHLTLHSHTDSPVPALQPPRQRQNQAAGGSDFSLARQSITGGDPGRQQRTQAATRYPEQAKEEGHDVATSAERSLGKASHTGLHFLSLGPLRFR